MFQSRYFEDYEVNALRETWGTHHHGGRHRPPRRPQTGDFYPHHMDAEWCKTWEPYKQRVAHGTLIFSVAIGMTAGEVNPEAFSYGYDRLRFVKPVFIGDTIRVRVTIKEKRDDPKRPGFGVVVERCEVLNQNGETVLACEHLLLAKRKNPSS